MKLVILLLTVVCLQVSANGYGQAITLKKKNASLEKVFEEIHRQTGYQFVYTHDLINKARKVSIDAEQAPLEEVLKACFKSQPFTYKLVGKAVVLTSKAQHNKNFTALQPIQVTGNVADSLGNPLIGAAVQVKNGQTGSLTDADGNYSITTTPDAVLVFSYIGFRTQEVPVNGNTSINIVLKLEVSVLDQLVVVGYGVQKRGNLTGSVASISGEKLENRVLPSAVEGLQGLIPNLNISVNNSGGEPGAKRSFNIRGTGSLSGGGPYVLVDGVEQDLYTVNPQDIESISVLKGAAASAIYGAHGPYGVILVTTKRGESGKMNISYSGNVGWNAPTVLPQKVNSLSFAQTYNQASANSGQDPFFSEESLERISNYLEDPENTPGTIPNPNAPNEWANWYSSPYLTNANTDWYDTYYKSWAINQTHNLSVSGGGDKTTYYISGGLFDQGGQFRYGNDSFTRYNLTSNIHTDITGWLNVAVKTKFSNRHIDMPYTPGGIGTYYHDAVRKWPTIPVFDPNGYILDDAIAFMAEGGRNIDNQNQFLGSFQFNVQPTSRWDINTDFSYRLNLNSGSGHKKEVMGHWVDESSYPFSKSIPTAYSTYKNESVYSTANLYTSYYLDPGKHFIKGMVGFQAEKLNYSNLTGNKAELVTDNNFNNFDGNQGTNIMYQGCTSEKITNLEEQLHESENKLKALRHIVKSKEK